jgi:hypothetical protein
MDAAGGAKEGSKFAPHAQYTRGKVSGMSRMQDAPVCRMV